MNFVIYDLYIAGIDHKLTDLKLNSMKKVLVLFLFSVIAFGCNKKSELTEKIKYSFKYPETVEVIYYVESSLIDGNYSGIAIAKNGMGVPVNTAFHAVDDLDIVLIKEFSGRYDTLNYDQLWDIITKD